MALFSERNGYVKPQDILIKEYITPDIQNAICNCLYDFTSVRLKLPDIQLVRTIRTG